jgi:xylan 1,4-beta-xylosidase
MKNACLMRMTAIVFFAATIFLVQAKEYNLTVQADVQTQEWNRFYEKGVATCHQYTLIDSYWKRGIGNALKVGHDEAGFQYWRGHGILHDDVGLVKAASENSLTLDWTSFDKVYDIGRASGMFPICEISTTPAALAANASSTISANYNNRSPIKSPPTKYGWGQWMNLMDSIVKHVENRYGAEEVRNKWYFEVWNEPNWWYSSFPDYLTLYSYTAAGLKRADSLIRVGGPSCQGNYTFTLDAEISKLLNHCKTATNPVTGKVGIPLDFLTWHVYADNPITVSGITGTVNNANTAVSIHRMILDSLRSQQYSWFKGPSLNDEVGPTSRVPVQRDMQQTASWLARTIHLFNEGGSKYPPPEMLAYWSISDIYEEGMNAPSNVSFQQGNYGMLLRGTSSYAPSCDIPKPVFQAYRLLHKLGAWEDSSSGGITTNFAPVTDGVGIIATSSKKGAQNDSIQILIYNHVNSTTQNSAPKDSVNLTVNNIPWAPGRIKVEHFAIDTIRSNTFTKWASIGKPAAPSNSQWDEIRKAADLAHYDEVTTTTLAGTTFAKSWSQNYYSVDLIILSNPDATANHNKNAEKKPDRMNTLVKQGKIILEIKDNEHYSVNLYTTAGQRILHAGEYSQGNASISIPKMAAGTFVLECRGGKNSFVKTFVNKK